MKIHPSLVGIAASCISLLIAAAILAGCQQQSVAASSAKVEQSQLAAAAANSIVFADNAEIDNIKARIELTSKPGLIGYITLLNQAGQPIVYETVKGKVTSGSKRLTKPFDIKRQSQLGNHADAFLQVPSPSDEGTWGSSGDYIFYWTQDGEYRQWNGPYLYSDKPYRLRVEPLVIRHDPSELCATGCR